MPLLPSPYPGPWGPSPNPGPAGPEISVYGTMGFLGFGVKNKTMIRGLKEDQLWEGGTTNLVTIQRH